MPGGSPFPKGGWGDFMGIATLGALRGEQMSLSKVLISRTGRSRLIFVGFSLL